MSSPTRPSFPKAAIERVLERLYGGPTREEETQVTVGLSRVIVADRDPERVVLLFINLGTTQSVFLSPFPQVSTTRGIRLGAQGGLVAMDVWEDAHLPTLEWHAIADAAGATLYRLSVKREQLYPGAE